MVKRALSHHNDCKRVEKCIKGQRSSEQVVTLHDCRQCEWLT